MSRAKMSPQERALRSRLAQIVHQQPLMRATLTVRHVTCGKPTCRCAQGHKHDALYLTCSVGGKIRQVFVPRALHKEVRQWVANYHTVQQLLERLSEQSWQRLKARKDEARS